MADILYMPSCSNCGRFLEGQKIERIRALEQTECQSVRLIHAVKELISPDTCPYCGAKFDTIKIPTVIPVREMNVAK